MGGSQPRGSVSLCLVEEQRDSGSSTIIEPISILQEHNLLNIRDMTALKSESLVSFGAPARDPNGNEAGTSSKVRWH